MGWGGNPEKAALRARRPSIQDEMLAALTARTSDD
jgi:hypothetical protein